MNYKRRIYISVAFILGLVAAMICWLRGSKSGEFRLGPLDSQAAYLVYSKDGVRSLGLTVNMSEPAA